MKEIDSLPDHTKGVLRQNERPCTAWAPKLGLGKTKKHLMFFLLFSIILGTLSGFNIFSWFAVIPKIFCRKHFFDVPLGRFLAKFFPDSAKNHLNNYWTGKNISFSFPLPLPALVILLASYYICHIIKHVNT